MNKTAQILKSKWKVSTSYKGSKCAILTSGKYQVVYEAMGEAHIGTDYILIVPEIDRDIARHIVSIHNDHIEAAKYIKP